MNLALINIAQLVTLRVNGKQHKTGPEMRELGIIENACVITENSSIRWVGTMADVTMGSLKEVNIVDCAGKVVMPGFVDAHTHAVFAGSRENEFALRAAGATYQEIAESGGGILSTVNHVRSATKKELKKSARRHLTSMLQHGTTTVEVKSGYGLDMDSEIKMLEAIRELADEEIIGIVATFLGAHARPPEYKNNRDEYISLICDKMIPYVAEHKLAAFCDVFCERGYFDIAETSRILSVAHERSLKLKIHAEELSPLGGAELAGTFGATSADHLEHITDEGIEALRHGNVVAVLLPGVSFFLNHTYAPARALMEAGVPVAIASDFNPGSCMSYSMPMMMTIACTHMRMTPEEALTASTLNAAAAIGLSDSIGSIEVGKKADMIVLSIPNYKFIAYHFGTNHVEHVIKDGILLEY